MINAYKGKEKRKDRRKKIIIKQVRVKIGEILVLI